MFITETGQLTNPRYIINFPTKRHWRGKSRMEDIDSGLASLVTEIGERNIRSIAIPPLGSGLGGLNWNNVRQRIEEALRGFNDVEVIVFAPRGAPEAAKMAHITEVPNMTFGNAAIVSLMERYLRGLLDPFVTLLEVHKLMYFMQEAGEPLKLRYTKGRYGPYAENLRHVLHKIEGHFVSGYADGGDAPDKQLELVPGALEDATAFLKTRKRTTDNLDKVSDLVEGFETPFGLELLATVHWVASQGAEPSVDQVVEQTYAWNERKKQFSPRQIELALDVLSSRGWIGQSDQRAH